MSDQELAPPQVKKIVAAAVLCWGLIGAGWFFNARWQQQQEAATMIAHANLEMGLPADASHSANHPAEESPQLQDPYFKP